jgi:Flp pilus assembly protein CpaB
MRRALSAALAAAAVAVGLSTLRPTPPAGQSVVVAARDLTGGSALRPGDVALSSRPAGDVPDGVVTAPEDALGRVLTSPVRHGELLTDVRLVGPSLVDALRPGQVAAPVRIADAQAADLVRPGDHVDVLVAVESGGPASVVARDATVLAHPERDEGGVLGAGDDGMGGLVLLAVTSDDAQALAGSAARGPLSLALRGG